MMKHVRLLSLLRPSLTEMYTHGIRVGQNGQRIQLSGSPVFAVTKLLGKPTGESRGPLRKYVMNFSATHAGAEEKYENVVVWAYNNLDAVDTLKDRLGSSDKIVPGSDHIISKNPVSSREAEQMSQYEDEMESYTNRTPHSGD